MHIYNDASVLVASWGFDDVELEAGVQQLRLTVPYLPLRPGTYTLLCSLFDGGNNLTGGKVLEVWNAVPFLAVDTLPLSHPPGCLGWNRQYSRRAEEIESRAGVHRGMSSRTTVSLELIRIRPQKFACS